ncbi:MAG: hypothetical protein ACJ702_00425 [Nitrososphaeraceae archaeon]
MDAFVDFTVAWVKQYIRTMIKIIIWTCIDGKEKRHHNPTVNTFVKNPIM